MPPSAQQPPMVDECEGVSMQAPSLGETDLKGAGLVGGSF